MWYLWSKEKIVDTLLKLIPYSPIFIDMCTGSGNVWVAYKRKYNNGLVVFNDIIEEQVVLLEWILTLDRPLSETFLFDLRVGREYFKFLLEWWEDGYTNRFKWFRRFVLMNWSFWNNLKWYMYWKSIELRKKAIHDTVLNIKYWKDWNNEMDINAEIVYNSMTDVGKSMIDVETFTNKLKFLYEKELHNKNRNNYAIKNIYARILSDIRIPKVDKSQLKNDNFKKGYIESLQRLERLQRLQRLESLESLQSLQRLESLESLQRLEGLQRLQSLEGLESLQSKWGDMEFTSQSMFEFDLTKYPIDKTLVYIDPPYEDTHWYWTPDINYDYFWERFHEHNYPMIASSYKARDYIRTYATLDKRKTILWNVLAKEWIYINEAFIEKYL